MDQLHRLSLLLRKQEHLLFDSVVTTKAVNKFIPHWHTPIPHLQRTISEKLVNRDAYGDIDMTNGFHQLPIDEDTSMKLSIQTPWGQVRPLFLP